MLICLIEEEKITRHLQCPAISTFLRLVTSLIRLISHRGRGFPCTFVLQECSQVCVQPCAKPGQSRELSPRAPALAVAVVMALAVPGAGLRAGTGLGAGTGLLDPQPLQRKQELPGPCLSQPGQAPGSSPQGPGSGWGDTEGPGLEAGPVGQDFGQKNLALLGSCWLPP